MYAFIKLGDQRLGGELELIQNSLVGRFTVKRSLISAGGEPQVGQVVALPAAGQLGSGLRIVQTDRDEENLVLWISSKPSEPAPG
jgi:hypothetical protein